MRLKMKMRNGHKEKAGFFRFKYLDNKYLLTNDIGRYCFLEAPEFDFFLKGKIERFSVEKYAQLKADGFVRNRLDFDGFSAQYALRNNFLGEGTGLHIMVVTLRCDHHCVYCQANAQGMEAKGLDMQIPVAEKAVDRIFESSSKRITIEFQGGEPLVNFETVKFIVEYAQKKNKSAKKDLRLSLVSNLTFMSNERLNFFIRHNVAICTSLDGPELLHGLNRPKTAGGSYRNTLKWIRRLNNEVLKNQSYKSKVNALTTITKMSLEYPEEIVDEFIGLGLGQVHLRSVNPFGITNLAWKRIGFSAEDFLGFYERALDYIIELNIKGKEFYERTALLFLKKVLSGEDSNFLDLRSPCGAGIGQLAYNFNGDVYACDEARMFSRLGDESFRVGNVFKNNYQDFISSDVIKSLCVASCLDILPGCSDCVYKPYCGVCPIYNYATGKNIFSSKAHNDRCRIQGGILDYLFKKIEDGKVKEVFLRWVNFEK